MSAFLCSPAHIGNLVRYMTEQRQTIKTAQEMAETLARANLRSVGYRYEMDEDTTAKEFRTDCETAEDFVRRVVAETWGPSELTAVMALKMAHCLNYQSCEPADWEGSPAQRLVAEIEDMAISRLPGYDEATWDYEPEAVR